MKRYISALLIGSMLVLASCADKYLVDGSTSVHGMEGKMVYLKVYEDTNLRNMDSCYVTHGKFTFKGNMDSTVMANLFVGTQSLMPVVIEGGDIVLKIDEMSQTVTGAELPRMEGRMVMDGMEHDEVMARLRDEAQLLSRESDQLVSGFIRRNYNNVLGPGIFMIMTSEYAYPVLTPQIEALLVGATPYFLNHPYVAEYIKVARENMEKLQQQ